MSNSNFTGVQGGITYRVEPVKGPDYPHGVFCRGAEGATFTVESRGSDRTAVTWDDGTPLSLLTAHLDDSLGVGGIVAVSPRAA